MRDSLVKNILTAKAATGIGTVINVADFKNIVLQIGTASSANLTIKIQGSISVTKPTFSSASTVANHWSYISCYDLDTASLVQGSTGFTVAGTDAFATYGVNVDGLEWLSVSVTAYAAGSVTVNAALFNNY